MSIRLLEVFAARQRMLIDHCQCFLHHIVAASVIGVRNESASAAAVCVHLDESRDLAEALGVAWDPSLLSDVLHGRIFKDDGRSLRDHLTVALNVVRRTLRRLRYSLTPVSVLLPELALDLAGDTRAGMTAVANTLSMSNDETQQFDIFSFPGHVLSINRTEDTRQPLFDSMCSHAAGAVDATRISGRAFQRIAVRRLLWHKQRRRLRSALLLAPDTGLVASPLPSLHNSYSDFATSTSSRSSQKGFVRNTPRIHFVTMASEDRPELETLRKSARVAGVELTVLGIGKPWNGFEAKVDAYFNYLFPSCPQSDAIAQLREKARNFECFDSECDEIVNTGVNGNISSNSTTSCDNGGPRDDDVVMFIDSYDVILFPYVHNAMEVLSRSLTPILFCAENGLNGEYTFAHMYYRGGSHDDSNAQFINSGCIVGRVAQMKHMFAYAHRVNLAFRNDQQIFGRYMFENPSMISLDTKQELFLTTWKLSGREAECLLQPDFNFLWNGKSIGLIHSNGMKIAYQWIEKSFTNALEGLHRVSNSLTVAATAAPTAGDVIEEANSNGGEVLMSVLSLLSVLDMYTQLLVRFGHVCDHNVYLPPQEPSIAKNIKQAANSDAWPLVAVCSRIHSLRNQVKYLLQQQMIGVSRETNDETVDFLRGLHCRLANPASNGTCWKE
jgi:hypothetical protein